MLTDADRLFGKLALNNGMLDQGRLVEATELHEKCGELGLDVRLARLLVDKGWIAADAALALDQLVAREIELPEPSEMEALQLSPDEDLTLGQLVFRNKLLTREQLTGALELQKQVHALGLKKRLGEILVERGLVDADTLAAIASIQRHLTDKAGELPTTIGRNTAKVVREDLFFGRLAVEQGLLTSEQLNAGLRMQSEIEQQHQVRYPLGGLLLDMGHLETEQLEQCLELQSKQMPVRPEAHPLALPEDSDTRLGKLIERDQLVSAEQVEEAARIQGELAQHGLKKKIGEVLLLKGYLTREALEQTLKSQRQTRRIRRRQLVEQHSKPPAPPSKKKWAIGGAAVLAALLLVVATAVAMRKSTPPADPAAPAFDALATQVKQLRETDPPDPQAALTLIDQFLARQPQGKWRREAQRLRPHVADHVKMIEERGGRQFLLDFKALRQLARDKPLAYGEFFARIKLLAGRYTKEVTAAQLEAERKRLQTRFYEDARALAIKTKAEAKQLAAAGKTREAIARIDSYPQVFNTTGSWGWLRTYRGELVLKLEELQDVAARDAYWAVQRKVQALRDARKLKEAVAACDTLPAKYARSYFAHQLQTLKAQILLELEQQELEQKRLAGTQTAALAAARIAALRARVPELIRAHRYLEAEKLIDEALAGATDPQLIAGLKADRALIGKLAGMMKRVRAAFANGLQIKTLLAAGKTGTLVGLDEGGFVVAGADQRLAPGELKPDGWSQVLFKSGAAASDPLTAARLLYRIGGVEQADSLLAGALQKNPELRESVHALLAGQGYDLPAADFVYHEGRWISGEERRHLDRGELRVGQEWWTRDKLAHHLSGGAEAEAAKQDPRSPAQVAARRKAYLQQLGVVAVRTIADRGQTNRRADIVIVSSGFSARQLGSFRSTARQIADSLGRTDPWGYYSSYINVHTVEVADAEGATPLGDNLIKMKVPIGGYSKGYFTTWRAASGAAWTYARLAPGADFVVVVCNVVQGSGSADSERRVATIHRAGSNRWDEDGGKKSKRGPHKGNAGEPGGDVAMALAHLLGHAVGQLADEYEYSAAFSGFSSRSPDDDFAPNVTKQPDVLKAPWHYWLKEPRYAPGHVKCYEGAGGSDKGNYRSQSNCIMRASSNRYCVVCREQIERTLLKYIRLVEQAEPAPAGNLLWRDGELVFRVQVIKPENHERERHSRFAVEWFLDGQPLGSRQLSKKQLFETRVKGESTAPGEHELVARVTLESPYLRRDFGRSQDYVAWRFVALPVRKPWIIAPKSLSFSDREFIRFEIGIQHLPEGFVIAAGALPEGASFDPATRVFSWRPRPNQTGAFLLRFSATNGKVSIPRDVRLAVRGGGTNYKPIPGYIPAIEVEAGSDLKVQLKAREINGDAVLYSLTGAPVPLHTLQFDPATGRLRWFVPHHLMGPYELSWEATDGRAVSRSKLRVHVRQSKLDATSRFPGHELGLGLWCPDEQIRQTSIQRLAGQPLSFQAYQLTRLLRDVNARVRASAASTLSGLLQSHTGKELALLQQTVLAAEGPMLPQHCVSPSGWDPVEKLLEQVASGGATPALAKEARSLRDELRKVRDRHK